MRIVPLSTAFDLTQGEISAYYHPKTLLPRNQTYARRAMLQSIDHHRLPVDHCGARGCPSLSRSGNVADVTAVGSALNAAACVDRCSTPISELYRAINQICGDKYSRELASDIGVGQEDLTSCDDSVSASSAPGIPYELRRSGGVPAGEREEAVIYETGPKERRVAPHMTPGGGLPLDTRGVVRRKQSGPLPPRDPQGVKQVQVAPQSRCSDELPLLCRVPAATHTLSQRGQPDPHSPLECPRVALPTHTCCSLAGRDTERTEDTTSLRAHPVRSQFLDVPRRVLSSESEIFEGNPGLLGI